MVSRKSAQRFSVRDVSHGLCLDNGAAPVAGFRWLVDKSITQMGHRPADSGRGPAGAHGEARHADNGWSTCRWLSFDFYSAVGVTFERICMVHRDSHAAI